jgi:hypothetical protein
MDERFNRHRGTTHHPYCKHGGPALRSEAEASGAGTFLDPGAHECAGPV